MKHVRVSEHIEACQTLICMLMFSKEYWICNRLQRWLPTFTQSYTELMHLNVAYFFVFNVCKSVHRHTFQIKQPTRCNNSPSLLLGVYIQLNMLRASSRPSSRAQKLQYQPLVLPLESGGSIVVGRGRAGQPARPRPTTLLSPRSNGKTRGCYSSCCAPDDGREDARNMLSCI
jgi:hypothetical protein